MSDLIDVTALWQGLVASLVAGVGIAAVFAVGLLGLSMYEGWTGDADSAPAGTTAIRPSQGAGPRSAGLVLAVLSFALVLGGIGLGIYAMLTAAG